jgi:4-amino-4-deoxy-L-arabinose transferase-like glycosyltransferase
MEVQATLSAATRRYERVTRVILHPWFVAGLLLALATALRFYHLDGQLWLDEISALRGYRKPFLETLTTFPVFFPNPLYELIAHASLVSLGESAASIRLPAAVFGVGSILIFYRLAQRCLRPGEAVLAAALLGVSYHHVYYSQDARGYTAYLFFALLAADRLLALLETMRWRTAFTYTAGSALATYAHPFGIFVLVGQIPVALATAWSRRKTGVRPTPTDVLATGALGALATIILYAPLIRDSMEYAFTEARNATHGPRMLALLPELIEGMRASFGASPVLLLGVVVGVIGAFDLARRRAVALSLLVAPLVISALTIAVLGAGVHPRYFLLALPLGYLVGTRGLVRVVGWLLERVPWLSAENRFRTQIAIAVLVTIVACIPLLRYYSLPKQDYLGALREVRQLAGPEDQIVTADLAGTAITAYYDPHLRVVNRLQDLLEIEASSRRVWVLTTLERVMAGRAPDLLTRLHGQYELVRTLAGSVGDGSLRIYMREAGAQAATASSTRRAP